MCGKLYLLVGKECGGKTCHWKNLQECSEFFALPVQDIIHTEIFTLYNVCSVRGGGGGGFSNWRDIMSALGGYHEYIGGCSVHWGYSVLQGFQ